MRFHIFLVFLAALIAVMSTTAISSDEGGKTAKKDEASVVKVSVSTRQTITAIHPGSSPKQKDKSEAWWMTFSGLVLLLISVGAFFIPKAFMYGRRSWFWRDLIGEKATAIMIRVVSCIVGVAGALVILAGIFISMDR
jgi:hypothetical protein